MINLHSSLGDGESVSAQDSKIATIGLPMNENNERTAIPPGGKGDGFWFAPRALLEPRALLFSVALVYCVSVFLDAMQKKENPFVFSRWMFVRDLMMGPLLLLIPSVLILINRLSTTALAMTIAGYLFYVTGYRGLISIPNSHGVPILSLDTPRIWFAAMPNDLILQTVLAMMILVFGSLQSFRLLRARRKRLS